MKTKTRYILTAVLLAVVLFAGIAQADRNNKYRRSYTDLNGNTYYALSVNRASCRDTLFGLTYDTVTVVKAENSEGLVVFIIPDSNASVAATDSIAAFYRPIPEDTFLTAAQGSKVYPLPIRNATGDTSLVVDWTPDALYWVEKHFIPMYGKFQQFLIQGSAGDTIPVTIVVEQVKTKPLR